jgi:hypothetical protein
MLDLEAAWLAGLLEGEGCFGLQHVGNPKRRNAIRVSVKMCDEDVVQMAACLMDAKVRARKDNRKDEFNDTYECSVSGRKAEDVMLAVRPYMGQRRSAKIDELLEVPNLSHHPKEVETNA